MPFCSATPCLRRPFSKALTAVYFLFVLFLFSISSTSISGASPYLFETILHSLNSKPWTPMKKSRLKIFNLVRSKYLTSKQKITS